MNPASGSQPDDRPRARPAAGTDTARSLAGRAGLVTGAGSGIGRETALAIAAAGGYVLCSDRDGDRAAETAAAIGAAGGEADAVVCDVARAGDVEAAVAKVASARGQIDFAHNNAGVPPPMHAIDELPEEEWDRVVGVNLKGVWLCLKYEIAAMRRQGSGGAIVNTASICAVGVAPMTSPYNAAKHGVVGLTKEAALEYPREGIRVNALLPGYTTTEMSRGATGGGEVWDRIGATVPLGRVAEASEMAEAVVWLLSDASSYVTGHSLVVDGGVTQTIAGPVTPDG